jgi:hypothetical protein
LSQQKKLGGFAIMKTGLPALADSRVFIAGHMGLGDHILCNGIYREYAKLFRICVIPVSRKYVGTLHDMLKDLKNVFLLACDDDLNLPQVLALRTHYLELGFKILNLGTFGENHTDGMSIRFDESYYNQAKVDFQKRWSAFYYPREFDEEISLFELLGCKQGEYIFLHEDPKRGMIIDRSLLDTTKKIITPLKVSSNSKFFNYGYVLQNASEIHCIESSFAALIESLQISVPKFAHRYARWEAKTYLSMEYTYQSTWKIYTEHSEAFTGQIN